MGLNLLGCGAYSSESLVVHTFIPSTGYMEFWGYTRKPVSNKQTTNQTKPNQTKLALSDGNHPSIHPSIQTNNKQERTNKASWNTWLQFKIEKIETALLSGLLLGLGYMLWHGTERETKERVGWPALSRYVELGTDSIYLVQEWR